MNIEVYTYTHTLIQIHVVHQSFSPDLKRFGNPGGGRSPCQPGGKMPGGRWTPGGSPGKPPRPPKSGVGIARRGWVGGERPSELLGGDTGLLASEFGEEVDRWVSPSTSEESLRRLL